MLVIHFDSKLILKLLEKKLQQHTVTLLVAEAQKGPKHLQMANPTLCTALLCLTFVIY